MNRRTLLRLAAVAAATASAASGAEAQTAAQPELPKEKLTIVTRDGQRHDFNVEMALTPEQQTVGLMFRREIPADGGMLFDWVAPRDSSMWMRNTISPLDMVFINADGSVRSIAEDTVPESLAIIESHGPVRATLELAAGTAKRLGIHAGDKVEQRIFTANP
ncbi:MAG: DUF192 domain-containing protein [Acetobacteraceae bacterium]